MFKTVSTLMEGSDALVTMATDSCPMAIPVKVTSIANEQLPIAYDIFFLQISMNAHPTMVGVPTTATTMWDLSVAPAELDMHCNRIDGAVEVSHSINELSSLNCLKKKLFSNNKKKHFFK